MLISQTQKNSDYCIFIGFCWLLPELFIWMKNRGHQKTAASNNCHNLVYKEKS